MAQKITHEQFLERLKEYNIQAFTDQQYINQDTELKFTCLIDGTTYFTRPANIFREKVSCCPQCRRQKLIKYHTQSHEDFIKRVAETRPSLTVLTQYQGGRLPITVQCENGHIWEVSNSCVLLTKSNSGDCPYCSGKKFLREKSLGSLFPELVKYFYDKDQAFNVLPHSMKKVHLICPDCGKDKYISPDTLVTRGFNCNFCKDGISYPNKILRIFLEYCYLNKIIEKYDLEFQDKWTCGYIYDGILSINNSNFVIEMQGLQHYIYINPWNKQEKTIDTDSIKKELAIKNSFQYIAIDCKSSNFDYIKQNIIDSELSNFIDMSKIPWQDLFKKTLSSLMIQSIELYNKGYKIIQISRKLKLARHTVRSYLKRGASVNLCNYH